MCSRWYAWQRISGLTLRVCALVGETMYSLEEWLEFGAMLAVMPPDKFSELMNTYAVQAAVVQCMDMR